MLNIFYNRTFGPFTTLIEIWNRLSSRRKNQFLLLSILNLLGGFAEAISLSLVVPFLAAMAAPEKILVHPFVKLLISKFSLDNVSIELKNQLVQSESQNAILFFAILFIFASLFAGAVRLSLLWASVRLASVVGTDLGSVAYRRTLYQPYTVHLVCNSDRLISSLTTKISMTVATLVSWQTLIASCVIILSVSGVLLLVSPMVALAAGFVLSISYSITAIASRKNLATNSHVIAREHNQMVKILQEGLGGIRDILLDGTQELFTELYRRADALFRRANANITAIGHSPRYIMETIGLVFFAILGVILTRGPEGLTDALPILGAMALGVQRMLPAMQQGYYAWSIILAYQESNKEVVTILNRSLPPWANKAFPHAHNFKREIRFDKIKFRYVEKGPWVLNGLCFSIKRGTKVGFIGKTGSGKSTCLDILMGLLEPCEGKVMIDGKGLSHKNLRAWQRNIAHVPQTIYLSDCTIAENIAFGIPVGNIDQRRMREAAHQAGIADFIESSPHGYQALVGERGVRLSGGQRQRIGIARALYKQAEVLVLDEATSALDHKTEQMVMTSISKLANKPTILIITHRASSLKNCDQIINLDKL